MAVMPNQEPHKYGGLATTPDGAMTGIVKRGDTTPSQHFVGIQVVEAEAFRAVPPDVPWESVAALYPALIAAKPGSVRTCTVAAEFHDIGTPRDYLETCLRLAHGAAAARDAAHAGVTRVRVVGRRVDWRRGLADALRGDRRCHHPCRIDVGESDHPPCRCCAADRRRNARRRAGRKLAVGVALSSTPSTLASPDERVAQYLGRAGLDGARMVPLTPDASDRRYMRVLPPRGPSQVLAVYPGPIDTRRCRSRAVATLLQAMPVPVPRVLGHDDALGIVAQEDLGDVTLQAHLATACRRRRARALPRGRPDHRHAAAARNRAGHASAGAVRPGVRRAEADVRAGFLRDPFPGGPPGRERCPAPSARPSPRSSPRLAGELSGEPRVVCHRDYHSRNLMVRDGRLAVIDFQDARLGPDTYDLASLLRDSYVGLEPAEVDALIPLFLALDRGPLGFAETPARFRERFDTMAVQRNLKALGTFGYQASVRRNTAYLRDVPRTLGYLRDTFERRPRFARLRSLLAPHLPELQA